MKYDVPARRAFRQASEESCLHGSQRKSYLSAPFFFHLRCEWLVRGRLYMPGQRHELHHKICNYVMELPVIGWVPILGSAARNMDWRIFIDTILRLLYTKPTSKSQTNNSYDYETFVIVIILTTFLSADPKPDIWLRIWSQNSVPVRQEIPFWWTIQRREHLIWLMFLHTHLCKKQQKIHPMHWKKHNILLS